MAKLKELRKLDLSWNDLERLPDGIEKLVLKELNWILRSEGDLHTIGPAGPVFRRVPIRPNISNLLSHDLLPNLVLLQCLVLHDRRFLDVRVGELSGLRKLEILSLSFSDLHNFNSYVRKQHYQRHTQHLVQLNGLRHYDPIFGLSKVVIKDCRLIGGTENGNDEHQQLVLPAKLRVLNIGCCKLLSNGGLLDVSPSLKTTMDLRACVITHSICGGQTTALPLYKC